MLEVAASAGDGAMLLAVEVRTDEALAAELDRRRSPISPAVRRSRSCSGLASSACTS
jgi:hypothetical protein